MGVIGAIVNGRNREKACALAGVAPEYDEIEFADEAGLREFVADRKRGANLTKSQTSIATFGPNLGSRFCKL